MRICGNCGSEVMDGARYCPNCGFLLPAEIPEAFSCVNCGAKLNPGARFCRVCGHSLYGKKTPVHFAGAYENIEKKPEPVTTGKKPGLAEDISSSGSGKRKPKASWKKLLATVVAAILAVEVIFIRPWEEWGGKPVIPVVPTDATRESGGPGDEGEENSIDSKLAEYLDYFHVSASDLKAYANDPPEITADNSPYNPAMLDVSFTKEEYESAYTISREVSRENPEADFDEFGIHVDLKSWNLDSETDTLTVKRLPDKEDRVYGTELYSYDFSLASGQDKFYTDVEITIPLQGARDSLVNALYLNEDTGKWEQVYYDLGEDGNSYTVYMDHFTTESGQKDSFLEDIRKAGAGMQEYASAFYIRGGYFNKEKAEMVKYDSPEQMPLCVDLNTLTSYIQTHREDFRVLYRELDATGGIPAEAAFQEECASYGIWGDVSSTAATIVTCLSKTLSKSGAVPLRVAGILLSYHGTLLYYLRMSDQMHRGVDAEKIQESNFWGTCSLVATGIGLAAGWFAAPAAATVATGAAVISSIIFVGTTVSDLNQSYNDKRKPLGTPATIEEGAYHYQLMNGYAGLDIWGGGWAECLSRAFDKFRKDPVRLQKQIQKYYDTYIDYFWDKAGADTRRDYWYKYGSENITRQRDLKYFVLDTKFPDEVYSRRQKIFNILVDSIDYRGLSKESVRRGTITPLWKIAKDEGILDSEIGFDTLDEDTIKAYKDKARKVLYKNTNRIMYDLYLRESRNAMLETLSYIRNSLLPILNTTAVFYSKDKSLRKDQKIEESPYYRFLNSKGFYVRFYFAGARQLLHFDDANDTVEYLSLNPKKETDELLRARIWQYIKFSCPTEVTLDVDKSVGVGYYPPLESTKGIVKWEDSRELENDYGKDKVYRVPVEFGEEQEDSQVIYMVAERVYTDWLPTVFLYHYREGGKKNGEKIRLPVTVTDSYVSIDLPASTADQWLAEDEESSRTSIPPIRIKCSLKNTKPGDDIYGRVYSEGSEFLEYPSELAIRSSTWSAIMGLNTTADIGHGENATKPFFRYGTTGEGKKYLGIRFSAPYLIDEEGTKSEPMSFTMEFVEP